ncbi:hypothetical protein L1887_32539 [Cichorium endivia]|nr:hypothetical protein L1887_32539 [Cichorium endivia]
MSDVAFCMSRNTTSSIWDRRNGKESRIHSHHPHVWSLLCKYWKLKVPGRRRLQDSCLPTSLKKCNFEAISLHRLITQSFVFLLFLDRDQKLSD